MEAASKEHSEAQVVNAHEDKNEDEMKLHRLLRQTACFLKGNPENGSTAAAKSTLQIAIEAELERLKYEDIPLCEKITLQKSPLHFPPDGETACLSIQHSSDVLMSSVDDYPPDDVLVITGFDMRHGHSKDKD